MKRIEVLLLFGGESAEHEVSIASARNVVAAIDATKYDLRLCYITKEGQWRLVDSLDSLIEPAETLMPVLGEKQFVTSRGQTITPDVLLPILHGPNGEDGSVQGVAQMLHVPIVGCGVLGSAVCMDKDVTNRLLKAAGMRVADYATHHQSDPEPSFAEISQRLGPELFIKPANLGSSVGVSKVNDEKSFRAGLATAHTHDRKVIIQRAVDGARELECSVLGNHQPKASAVGEIKPNADFYSYDAKYDPESQAELIIPAQLDSKITEELRTTAIKAFEVLECRGLARADFLLAEDGTLYINELNTMPGFTNISMYPKLWAEEGLGYSQLIDRLIELALEN